MNSKGKEGKARAWEQPSSLAGKAALVTGQVHSFQKPDLRAHASVAPTFVQAPERLQVVMESCKAGLLCGNRGERTVRAQFGKDYCCDYGGFLLRNNPQQIGVMM